MAYTKLKTMSKLILIAGLFFLTSAVCVESIYTHSVTTIEGVNKPLSAYQGKKLLILTLPVQQNASNDSLLQALNSVGLAYAGSLVIIAVPSYEDGYTPAIKDSLKQWYRSMLGAGIIVTEGLYTRKTSGNQQHPLFRWLTDKDKNSFFDDDVTGPGDKFIVWPNGELTSVLGSPIKIGGSIMNTVLAGQ
jgi:glutathione peroxidase